ncbi:5-methylcytosine rRNA methyltransferase NSUN4-like [Salmo trutta]|uniref:5-methylcytosine rRNA methyltransferase NSUN4-like n=1 Tax=Salmo trutta TaxID=8032 RepID=UPI0011311102|nr:5-methylcytosine rRNA methyltransferase NSUN4-like [Salmo trutta]
MPSSQTCIPRDEETLSDSQLEKELWRDCRRLDFLPTTTLHHSTFQVKLVENNIFKRARTKGRLPLLQTELLLSGIKAVRPGVEVVYSTCSLSQLQNQCMVEQAMHLAREEHGISLQVADLRLLTRLFKDTFQLAPDLHLGQLVLPHLTTNFGPIYMCKLQRLN